MTDRIELSEFILHVANEIKLARDQARDHDDPVMTLDHCEIEMALGMERNITGGLKVFVFQLGEGRTKSDSNTVRVQFTAVGAPIGTSH